MVAEIILNSNAKELDRVFRITDGVIRHIVVKQEN